MGISSLDVNLQWLHRNGFPEMGWPCLIHIRNFYQNSGWEMAGFWRFWTYPLVLLDHVKNQYTYQPLSWHDLTDKSWEFKSWQSLWIEHSFLRCPDRFADWTDSPIGQIAERKKFQDTRQCLQHCTGQCLQHCTGHPKTEADGSHMIKSPLGGIIFLFIHICHLIKTETWISWILPSSVGADGHRIFFENRSSATTQPNKRASKTRNWSQSLDNQQYQRNVRK